MSIKYENEFKEKVAREAISTNNITATSKKYGVNANSVRKWKSDLQVKLGMTEIQDEAEVEHRKDITLYKREVLELRRQLELTQNDLRDAMTLIGEKDLYIKKLKGGLNNPVI
ncbi:transposase [Lysinibacillus antri]|uniref:Transposase n=1 Tax=Lysinibacillus antri TaxID=2498145 RepID=A0A432L708_9BACI|nr:transposase [Lysinibacillus antri]RUL47225.1 hypothetical protein EK386_18730 [Lysinibacillus antri]